MPLESLGDPEKINVRHLAMERDEKEELPFDPERDITEEEWGRMFSALRGYRVSVGTESDTSDIYFDQLATVKMLSPERLATFYLNEKEIEEDLAGLLQKFKDPGLQKLITRFLTGVEMRIVYPQKASEIKSEMDAIAKERKGTLSFNPQGVLDAIVLKQLSSTGLLEVSWQEVRTLLQEYGERSRLVDFTNFAMAVKLLRPEKIGEIPLTKGMWDKLKESLREEARQNPYLFAVQALDMKVLAAHEAYIDDNGELVVHMEKPYGKYKKEPGAMPETRDF